MIPLTILNIEDDDDREFMADLYQGYYPLMLKRAGEIVCDQQSAEDMVQEAVVALIDKIGLLRTFDDKRRIAYVMSTVKHTSINYIKKGRAKKRLKTDAAELSLYHSLLELSPEESLITQELYRRMGRAVERLPEKERDLIYYRFWLEKDDDEIAALLNVKPDSLRAYFSRARKKLKQLLEEEETALV